MQTQKYTLYSQFVALTLIFSAFAQAGVFDWSNNEIQYLHGSGYRMPGNNNNIDYSIITVTHADEWVLGRIFSLWIRCFPKLGSLRK